MRYLSKECWTLVTCRAGLQKFNRPSQYNIYIFRHNNDIGVQNMTNMGVVLHIYKRHQGIFKTKLFEKGFNDPPKICQGNSSSSVSLEHLFCFQKSHIQYTFLDNVLYWIILCHIFHFSNLFVLTQLITAFTVFTRSLQRKNTPVLLQNVKVLKIPKC